MAIEENALKVFTDRFVKGNLRSPGGDWAWKVDASDAEDLGLDWEELDGTLRLLVDVGLITKRTEFAYSLTPEGRAACRDLSRARAAIWGLEESTRSAGDTFHIGSIENAQIGDHNVQNVASYLQDVSVAIQRDQSMDPEHKKEAAGMVARMKALATDLLRHVTAAGAGAATAEAVKRLAGG